MRMNLLLLILLAIPPLTSATTFEIHPTGMTIQQAIEACSLQGDTILLHPGLYEEELLIEGKAIVLGSLFLNTGDTTFTAETILSGDDTFRPLAILGNHTSEVVLAGLTISDGSAYDYTPPYGGGIYSLHASVQVNHCIIRDNRGRSGAAVFLDSTNVEITNSIIENNVSIEGLFVTQIRHGNFLVDKCFFQGNIGTPLRGSFGNGVLSNSVFRNNHHEGSGGGAFLSHGNWRVVNNRFVDNSALVAGALFATVMDSVFITGNEFIRNEAWYRDYGEMPAGGFQGALDIGQVGIAIITDNLFMENQAPHAGIMEINGSSATFVRNRFIGNRANSYMVGLFLLNGTTSSVTMQQNHFAENLRDTTLYDPTARQWEGFFFVSQGSSIQVEESDFIDNDGFIIDRFHAGLSLRYNYWGDPSGPYHPVYNPEGLGDTVLVNLDAFVEPWATEHLFYANIEPDTNLLDFGVVEAGGMATLPLMLRNTGVETLIVRGGICEDASFMLELGVDSLVLASGEQAEVAVRFSPTDTAPRTAALTFDCNDPAPIPESVELIGNVTDSAPGDADRGALPKIFELEQPYPNPFNPGTVIRVALPRAAPLRVEVFNLLGERVALLHDSPARPGYHSFPFDSTRLASGLYMIRASSPIFGSQTHKALLVR